MAPMRVRFSVLCFILAPLTVFAQGLQVDGRVLDAETGKPLPFANLQIEGTRLGTNTNVEGYFSLFVPNEFRDRNLLISYIGYGLFKQSVQKIPRVVRLAPESRQLKEVVVMPDSSLLMFLREAYRNIESNYTTEPYQLRGFYRESLKLRTGSYYYFGEAELLVQGSGYQFTSENGTVKVLKSRINHFAPADSIRAVLYYGGPFIGISNDLVKYRPELLRPDKKDFTYQLIGTEKNLGNEIWVITFTKKDGTIRGKLYVEKDSKAYVRTEITRAYKDSANRSSWSRVHDINTTVQNTYVRNGGKWFLAYSGIRKTQFNTRLKKHTAISGEFSTSEIISDSAKRIRFDDELEYTGIFSQLQNAFSSDFWKGSSTLLPDSSLQAQVKPLMDSVPLPLTKNDVLEEGKEKQIENFEKLQRKVRFLTRFGQGLGLTLLPVIPRGADVQMQYPIESQSLSFVMPVSQSDFPLLFSGEAAFAINRRLQAFANLSGDFSPRYEFRGVSLGIRYSLKLNTRGNSLLLRPSLAYGAMLMGVGGEVFDNPGGIVFDGKTVTDDRLRFYVGERVAYLLPSLALEKKLHGLRWVFLDAGYFLPLKQHNMLFLEDRSGFFLFRQFRSLPLEESNASVTQNGQTITSQNLNWFSSLFLQIGFRWRF